MFAGAIKYQSRQCEYSRGHESVSIGCKDVNKGGESAHIGCRGTQRGCESTTLSRTL